VGKTYSIQAKPTWQLGLITLSVLTALFYTHFRAYTLAFTYDECWTFLDYANRPFLNTLFNRYPAANNHVLHSLLMKGSYMLFGMHEYVLRLPVLLAQLFFLVYTYRILNRFGTSFSWLVFIILALNPYVLDYFTLARGYGLSLAFMVMSLYFILNFHQITRSTTAYLALLFALLAAFANFTYSLIFISAAAAVFVVYVQSGRWKKGLLISGLAVLLGFGLLYIPLSALVKANELYYGGEAGFLQDTLVSLTEAFTYYKWPSEWLWMPLVLVCVVLSLFVYSLWINLNRFEKVSPVFLMLLFLLLPAIGSILQHLILGTPFLINRTALFFYTLVSVESGAIV
jgi:4-amino-4-deoxy-L-arabinose transferase-like glycosyltransferase